MFYRNITSSRLFRQYLAGLLCSLSMSIMASGVNWSGPAIPKLQGERPDVNLTNNEITWMVSSLYIGCLVSPIPCGYLMDRFGRKRTLLCATIFSIISCVSLYFAVSPYHFYIARFLSGLVNGVVYTITPIYIAEIAEPKVRGSIGNMMSVLTNLSPVYIYSIGFYVSYGGLVIATSLIPISFLLTFIWMPETPHYYLMKNNTNKAIESLTWFRCDKANDDVIDELNVINLYVKEQMRSKSSYKEVIVTKANRKALLTVQFLSILQRFSGVGAFMAYSSVFIPKDSISFLSLNQCINILGIVWFITTVISMAIIDRFNRRTLLILSSFGCGIANILISCWFYLNDKTSLNDITQTYKWIPYVSLLCHAEFFAIGVGPLCTSMRGELFAANIKGKGSALTSVTLALTSFVIGKFFLTIADSFGMYLNFLIFGVICLASIIIIYFYVIETTGKTLEDIQDELNGKHRKDIDIPKY